MPPPEEPAAAPAWARSYTLHPLRALDGVLIHCTLNGETVASCFGVDERAAAEALARQLPDFISTPDEEQA
jgi:hypothetical protein